MNRVLFTIVFQLACIGLFAQVPLGISYQAVIRDGTGNLVKESEIGMRISILQGTETGIAVFSETHSPVTNINGLATITIGSGETTITGDLVLIDWSEGPFFLQVEVDPEGGSEYGITNISQILSVPYALYAEYAEKITGAYVETQDLADVLEMGNSANAQIKYIADATDPQDAINKKTLEMYFMATGFAPMNFSGAVRDTDQNIYKVVTLGTQKWMAENLRTTRLNDGIELPLVTSNVDWASLSTPGYCWYSNVASNSQIAGICGALYNWYAINTGNLCPTGWHIPQEHDFQVLIEYLGGEAIAGGKMKESGTKNWNLPNTGASNISGLTVLPAGFREHDGAFIGIANAALFWTSKDVSSDEGSLLMMVYNSMIVAADSHNKNAGISIRCVKD